MFKRPLCPVREKEQEIPFFPQQYWSGLGPKEPASELERVANKNIRLSGRLLKDGGMVCTSLWASLALPIPSSPLPVCALPGSRCCCLSNTCLIAADVLGLNKNQIARSSPGRQCHLSNSEVPIGVKDLQRAED